MNAVMNHEGAYSSDFSGDFSANHAGHHHEVEEMSAMDHNLNHDQAHSMGHMMMKMYFHFGFGDTLLFSGLVLDSSSKLILSCLVLFILAIFNEAINYLRRIKCECELKPLNKNKNIVHDHEELTGNGGGAGGGGSCCQNNDNNNNNNLNNRSNQEHSRSRARRCCSVNSFNSNNSEEDGLNGCSIKHCEFSLFRSENKTYKLIQAILYIFQTGLAFTLMLAAMTYNVCIIFAIVLGAGFGYYIFYRPIVDVEVCH